MRFCLLLALAGSALRADVVTYTGTVSSPLQVCGFDTYNPFCAPFDFYVPKLDPSLGILQSVAWSFTDQLTAYGGVNDLYQPVGLGYSWTTTETDQSALLGLNASAQQFNQGITCSCRQQVYQPFRWRDTIQATGSVADLGSFTGVGWLTIPVTPSLAASWPVEDGNLAWVSSGLFEVIDIATLQVTETYAPAVPEPRWGVLGLLVGLIGIATWRRSR